MKKITLLFLLLLSTALCLNAQGLCPTNGISTDPANPINPHNPDVVNDDFNWLEVDYTRHFKE